MPAPLNEKIALLTPAFWYTLSGVIALDIASYFAYGIWQAQVVVFIATVLIVTIASLYKLEYGLYAMAAELCVGSQGYLAIIPIAGINLSLRMGLWIAVLSVWLLHWLRRDAYRPRLVQRRYFILLAAILGWGVINGLIHNSIVNVFFDANAWLFFALGLVLFDAHVRINAQTIMSIIVAASGFLAIKTISTLYAFSHGLTFIGGKMYHWIRNSGVGEITYIEGTLFRIFFQSQLYIVIGLVIVFGLLIAKRLKHRRDFIAGLLYVYLATLAIVISQSRSFWVGAVAGIIFLIVFILRCTQEKPIIALASIALVTVVLTHNQTIQVLTGSNQNQLIERFQVLNGDPASSSRINQLQPLWSAISQHPLLGSGFGAEVTYQSQDPRIVKTKPGGWHTTYAFEWGYQDIWLKLGLVGLALYLFLLTRIIINQFKNTSFTGAYSALFTSGLAAVMLINVFSPYLNHPLGIGYFLITATLTSYYNRSDSPH